MKRKARKPRFLLPAAILGVRSHRFLGVLLAGIFTFALGYALKVPLLNAYLHHRYVSASPESDMKRFLPQILEDLRGSREA